MSNSEARALNLVSAVISISGIVFQLLLAANMSYLLGNAVLQYSITIGLFLSGMGVGSYFSRFIRDEYIYSWFILGQLSVALVGGSSTFLLFTLYAYTDWYQLAAYLMVIILGTVVGTELPMLVRMVTNLLGSLREGTSGVLAWDYLGSLLGSLAVPLLVVPYLGYVRGAFIIGILNLLMGLYIIYRFKPLVMKLPQLKVFAAVVTLVLVWGISFGDDLAFSMEQKLYRDRIVRTIQTEYQRLTLTKSADDLRLYINGNLQFSSADEYRYHEALVHIPAGFPGPLQHVLVLGGGDGLVVRELLKYQQIRDITLVDLDPKMVQFAMNEPLLTEVNGNALRDKRVKIISQDAYKYLEEVPGGFDLIIVDLPDPNDESLSKLYSMEFYALARQHLSPDGRMVLQATSPVFAREVFWTINQTVQSAGLQTFPYHVDVPSFGDWGFVLASEKPISTAPWRLQVDTRYLTQEMLPSVTTFAKDEGPTGASTINTLLKPVIVPMYLKAWRNY